MLSRFSEIYTAIGQAYYRISGLKAKDNKKINQLLCVRNLFNGQLLVFKEGQNILATVCVNTVVLI